MGLFSSECNHCGSKEHSSGDCPHGIFSSKCSHCNSKDHASNDCPHGIFSSKCSHCDSKNHASNDCPHGIFSSKCSHCDSKDHASSDCPHGIFSSKCSNCGSKNHSSGNCPHGLFSSSKESSPSRKETSSSETSILGLSIKLGLIAFAIAIALTILTIAFLLAPVGLLIWYLINKRKNHWIAISGVLIGLYLTYDTFSNGLITGQMMNINPSEGIYASLLYFVIIIIISALLFDKYSLENIPLNLNGNIFAKNSISERRKIIIGSATILIMFFGLFNFVDFSNNNSQNKHRSDSNITDYSYENTRQESVDIPKKKNTVENNSKISNTNTKALIIGNWSILNEGAEYNFFNNSRGNYKNSKSQIFHFDWKLTNSNKILNIKLDIDNSQWNWNLNSISDNKIKMFSQQHNLNRIILKGKVDISKYGIVNASDVIIRKRPSTKSKIISSVKNSNESVKIIDVFSDYSNKETLLNNSLIVNINNENIELQKGKAITVISINNSNANISFKDKTLKTHRITIDKSYLEKISNNNWYKIERSNGETGWMFGRFITLKE